MWSPPRTHSSTKRCFLRGQRGINALRTLRRCKATAMRPSHLYPAAWRQGMGQTSPRGVKSRRGIRARLVQGPSPCALHWRRTPLAPCPNTLFGPLCAAYSGLVAFLQRLGLEVVPVDNDPNGWDRTHDILHNEFCSNLVHRAQRGEFIAIWAAPPCSTLFSICRFLPSRTPGGGPPVVRRRQEEQVTGALDCPRKSQRA